MREALRREDDWTGRTVTVMGLGLFGGGLGAARFALEKGANVTVTDLRGAEVLSSTVEALCALPGAERVELVLGEHRDKDFQEADIVLVNPAVPPRAPHLALAREGGARVTSAIELLLGGLACRVVAITGTHGKSSTVHFTADLLRAGLAPGTRVALGGNIGGSLLGEMDQLKSTDVVVLELSSYQLENLGAEFVAAASTERVLDVAAITTIGVDHLARHRTVEAYRAAKLRIAQLTGQDGREPGVVIAPAREDGALRELLPRAPGLRLLSDDGEQATFNGLQVPGDFQRANLRVAWGVAEALGADPRQMERAIPHLTGLPHRMEPLPDCSATPCGRRLRVFDNGVSTTPESTVAAMESASGSARPGEHKLVLVGGQAKVGCDLRALGRAAATLGWVLVPFGSAAEEIAAAARSEGASFVAGAPARERDGAPGGVEAAVELALEHIAALPPSPLEPPLHSVHLLFSPACASFDRYPNFKARALAFRGALSKSLGHTGTQPKNERLQSKD